MEVGILGLEGSGKKTLFSLLTGLKTGNYSGEKGSVGVVNVPDERVDYLSGMFSSKKKAFTQIKFNLLGPVKKDSDETKKMLSSTKLIDMYAIVLRQFTDENVYHPLNSVDISRDYSIIRDELLFSDLLLAETRLNNIEKQLKRADDPVVQKEKSVLEKFKGVLENGQFLSSVGITEEEGKIIRSLSFATLKPIFVIINCDESRINDHFALKENVQAINISVKIEEEIQHLEGNEKKEFLESLGLKEASLDRIIKFAYAFGNLISFLTTGPDESRSWTVKKGTTASKAAGVIHSDIEKGFIRAEVTGFSDLKSAGSMQEAKSRGLSRLEGRDYQVKDGDIIEFRFNV